MSDPSVQSGNTQYIGVVGDNSSPGGGGTPNVAIAGTDASGNPIQSPVLLGNAALDNLTLDGGNTNIGFRATVLGSNNANAADHSIIVGVANQVSGQNHNVAGNNHIVAGSGNDVSGANNEVFSDRNSVSGYANQLDPSSTSNRVSGNSNTLIQVLLSEVSGSNHHLTDCIGVDVSGNFNTLVEVYNSIVSGYANDVAPLTGTGADFNNISGSGNFVRGDSNHVSGINNTVRGLQNHVSGVGHTVDASSCSVNGGNHVVGVEALGSTTEGSQNTTLGTNADVSGEGNIAHYGQIVKGRYAVEDTAAADATPTPGQMVEIVGWGADDATRDTIRSLDTTGHHDVKSSYGVAGTKVVGPRELGWSAPTGASSKASFDPVTVTLEQLAERVAALTNMCLQHGLIGAAAPSPLLTDYTYIIPSSGLLDQFSRSGAVESYNIRLTPTGPANTFQTVRVGFSNTGAAYTVDCAYLMQVGNANTTITEDPATGLVTVAAAPFVVAAGTNENPTWHWINVSVPTGTVSEFQLLVQMAVNSPRTDWGSSPYLGMGWIWTNTEKLTTNLTDGINFAGGGAFGSLPPIAVKFESLSTPVLWLPFVGDSWMYGFGDGGGPWRPFGIEGRLNDRWSAAAEPIAVIGYAKSGFTTTQCLSRLQNLLANFDCRAACVQFNSLNNVLAPLPDTQCRTDWIAVEAAMDTRAILPIVAGGMLDSASPGWYPAWDANTTWMTGRNADTNVSIYDYVVDPLTGEITSGNAFTADYAHLNSAGYDNLEVDAHVQMRAVIASWGI